MGNVNQVYSGDSNSNKKIAGTAAFLTSIFTLVAGLYFNLAAFRTLDWTMGKGVITHADYQLKANQEEGNHEYSVNIRYEYIVSGEKHTGDVIYRHKYKFFNESDAEEITKTYSKDTSVTVLYNPSNPSEAVLESGGEWGFAFVTPLLLFVALAFFMSARKGSTKRE